MVHDIYLKNKVLGGGAELPNWSFLRTSIEKVWKRWGLRWMGNWAHLDLFYLIYVANSDLKNKWIMFRDKYKWAVQWAPPIFFDNILTYFYLIVFLFFYTLIN